jgi:DNA-3-methyladenine glycosylase II
MSGPLLPSSLNPASLLQGVEYLCTIDRDLALIREEFGPPPLWAREPGFPTLIYIILEQQVSLASAKAAFSKLKDASIEITPEKFLQFNDEELKRFGFSRQKMGYCRGLARSILDNELDLNALVFMDDADARSALIRLKGIGPWTADIYLLMALLRPDIWPAGDLALAAAVQKLKGLSSRPVTEELELLAIPWQPWRAVAARLLWHFYLST